MPNSFKKISTLALVLLITGAIDSVRNLPTTALFGSTLIFFFIVSAIVFLIPVALISAELATLWPDEEGGIYSWIRYAFNENIAFFAVWLQWINTIVWYPTILSFIAGTLSYLINPILAQNQYYIIGVSLTVFWALTFLNLAGFKTSSAFASFCALVGMIFPMALIIILAGIWVVKGNPLAVQLNWHTVIPRWQDSQSWVSLTAIMTAFLGIELAAVHVRQVKNPQRNFPKAMFFSVILILLTMIFGSLAIAVVLPVGNINLVDGVMEAFSSFFQSYHLTFLVPILVILLLLGSLGGMINWIISPAKGLLLAAKHQFLPAWLYRLNNQGVASRILILQAVLVTVLSSGFLLFPSINAIYWLFTVLSTELYMLMYVLMFFAAWRIKNKFANLPRAFCVPGKRLGYYTVCIMGLLGCFITLVIGFVPPKDSIDLGNSHHFCLIFSLGLLIMVTPAFFMCIYRRYKLS